MPVLHFNEEQYPLKPGATSLGAAGAADVPVGGEGVQAVVELDPARGVTIRRASSAASVRVNGVALGAEPTPLLHGDRVEIGGAELRYADDQKGGATQFVSAGDIAAMAAKRSGPAVATTGTGGRLVSLVDGKEYTVPATGLVIGREVGADVVVPLAEVSRRHAEIVPTAEGYRLTDLSTNGVLVNGERVAQTRLLARADVIRVGTEEFRFYADVAPRQGAPAPAATVPVGATVPAAEVPAAPAAAAIAPGAAAPASTAPGAGRSTSPPPSAPGASSAEPLAAGRASAAPPPAPPPAAVQADAPPARPTAAARPAAPKKPEPAPASGGFPLWLLVVILVAVAAGAFLLLG